MSMKDTLKKAKIAAMKAKDKAKLNPINLTLADIQNLGDRQRSRSDRRGSAQGHPEGRQDPS